MDIIQNREKKPDMYEIEGYITGQAKIRWRNFVSEIEIEFQTKPMITFSVCSAKPGWNVKYKKSGKALCTLYPEKNGFIALVVLGVKDIESFDSVRKDYNTYINQLFDRTNLFNGTKWMMINVSNQDIADDTIKLIRLKREAANDK